MTERRRHPLWELTVSRMKEFYREPGAIFWTFGFPVLIAVALGIAFRNKPPDTWHVGLLGPPAFVAATAPLLAGPGLETVILDEPSAEESLRKGRIDLVLTEGASPDGGQTDGPHFIFRFDPTRAESSAARLAVESVVQKALGRADVAQVRDDLVTRPGSRYIDFLIPGLIGLNVLSSSMWGTGYSIVYARKRKLLRRLAATPMRRSHYLLSHMFSRFLFLAAEVVALLFFGWLVFDVHIQGSLLAVATLSLVGGLSFSGMALLIAARPESTEVASGWMNAVMMPMYLLSGSFFSYERFPEVFHPVLRLLPLTAFNDALRGVVNEGAGFVAVLPQVGILAAWGLVSYVVALRVFRWV